MPLKASLPKNLKQPQEDQITSDTAMNGKVIKSDLQTISKEQEISLPKPQRN